LYCNVYQFTITYVILVVLLSEHFTWKHGTYYMLIYAYRQAGACDVVYAQSPLVQQCMFEM